jgi:tellurite resistance protein TerC
MLVGYFGLHLPVYVSLLVIVFCIGASILYSINVANKQAAKELASKEPE